MDKPQGFNLKYLFVGDGWKDWYKALGNGWRMVVIFIVIIVALMGFNALKNMLFPTGDNVHKPFLIALPGSTVMNPNLSSTQEMNKKRSWFMPIPYVAIYGGASNKSTNSFDFEPEYGAQVGVRWDFD